LPVDIIGNRQRSASNIETDLKKIKILFQVSDVLNQSDDFVSFTI
jgi:hypothetical protein